jgi:hypothetical protein
LQNPASRRFHIRHFDRQPPPNRGPRVNEQIRVRGPVFDDLCRELELLRKLSQGVFPNPGTPVDASDAGPLGPIWASPKPDDRGS